ncbi:hypothetical protein [Jannaschia pohangensis]|uniref:Uncharacterized protein n=1 Tax=Jannaschia pohangensis TaxID=390807 RepID=A0A1I3IIQ6_9RHOB|nr:hypothetical protein [Jannaschia pohangensis]SFI47864.1 hypothetical protein SAMN04488095_0990 [Jannaschia pohangensis]
MHLALSLCLAAATLTMPGVARGQFFPDVTADPELAARAEIAAQIAAGRDAALSQPQEVEPLSDIAPEERACESGALAACALDDPKMALATFCDAWTDARDPTGCAGLAERAEVTPLRLARAIALTEGAFLPPEGIAAQVRSDAEAVTRASVLASRGQSPELDLSGPALAPTDTGTTGDVTLDDILPNGIAPGQKGLDAAVIAVIMHPRVTRETQPALLTELRNRLSPDQRAMLPEPRSTPATPPARLIGDPMTCDGGSLPTRMPALNYTEFDLPEDLHGDGALTVWMVTDTMMQDVPVERVSATSARIFLPMAPEVGSDGGGPAGLVLMFADGARDITRRCALRVIELTPPEAPAGAHAALLAGMAELVLTTNALSGVLETGPVFSDAYQTDMAATIGDLETAYAEADPASRRALDAMAHALTRTGLDGATQAWRTRDVMADLRSRQPVDGGWLLNPDDPFSFRVLPAQGTTEFSTFDTAAYERSCPVDAEELNRWIRMQFAAEFGTAGLGKGLLTASSVAASASAELFVASVSNNKKARQTASAAVGLAYAAYSIHLDYLKGMLPSSLPSLDADIWNPVIHEDEPNLRVYLERVQITSKSKGWDSRKAALDAAIAIAGALGQKGAAGRVGDIADDAVTAAARQQIGNRAFSRLVGKPAAETQEMVFDLISRHPAFADAAATLTRGTAGAILGEVDNTLVGEAYNRSTEGEADWRTIPPVTCRTELPVPEWATVRLEDPNLVYERVEENLWRPLKSGRAVLIVEPRAEGDRWSGKPLPVFRQVLTVPLLRAVRVESPGAIQPGEGAVLVAGLEGAASSATTLDWTFETPGIVRHDVTYGNMSAAIYSSRNIDHYPLRAQAAPTGDFLPESDAPNRFASFVIQAGELWLVPSRNCVNPGGSMQIYAFDARTGDPVPARDLVFRTDTRGIDIDGTGLVTSTRRDDYVTISARGVGRNAWKGQVRIRADCTCGAARFDPGLVTDAGGGGPLLPTGRIGADGGRVTMGNMTAWLPAVPGWEIFGVSGQITLKISGDYQTTVEQPFVLDLIMTENETPFGPACHLLTGGTSAKYLGTQMMFAAPGPLLAKADGDEMRVGDFSESLLTYFLEDFGGPDRVLGARPSGPTRVRVVELRRDHLVIELSGPFRAEGFSRRPGEQTRNVHITARFEAKLP